LLYNPSGQSAEKSGVDGNTIDPDIAIIIAQIPAWAGAEDLRIEPARGLTNRNYLATVDGEQYVLRVGGSNAGSLGIDRESELAALQAASSAGIGAELVHFILPQGHLVTRWISGRHLRYEEYCDPGNLGRVVDTVRRVHSLPPTGGTFSPFRRIEDYARQAANHGVPFPEDFGAFLERMRRVEAAQREDRSPWFRFCHNDLFFVNILDDGAIRMIDWEFAGMGDLYFDLATLVYAYDTHNPLPADMQEYLLGCYFSEVVDDHRRRLDGMKYMVLFFTAMWGMLQEGLLRQGIVPAVEGFDYLVYAQNIFEVMREALWGN
jgi:thiamine kinase-like enzyme